MARQQDDGIEDNPQVQQLTGAALTLNNSSVTAFTAGTETSSWIRNIVSFKLKEETPLFIRTNFTFTIQVKIEYGASASSFYTINSQDLTVSFNRDPRSKYNATNYFHFSGAKYVKVTIINLPQTTIGGINIGDLLMVENEMRVTRYYNLNNNVQPTTFSATTPATGDDELTAAWSWPANAGLTHTQLEWTWLENEMASYYFVNGSLNYDKLFRNNSTRIDLPYNTNNYRIPLLYGDAGKLYCRIRAVNLKKNGSRSDGPWSNPVAATFVGHNDSLNWQASISFAEEGKRAAVIQYFDGSLRGRQTVTKDNITNTTIATETFYDGEGRPAVQIMPTPGLSNKISYAANFNLFDANAALQLNTPQAPNTDPSAYFDLQPVNNPTSQTPALQTGSGAARYYSTANPEKNTGFNKNIPDAEGFPYTVIRYTPDGTGRIQAQSSAGAAFQMGKGHETKYYYGTAAQEELDGLFGTEVGIYTHYFKNMMKDANGQMSISYTDMHGRTIATALAGEAPANLAPLARNATHYPKQQGDSITRNLLNAGTNVVKNNSIESVNTLLVPVRTKHTFTYKLDPDKLSLLTCAGTTVCYDCMYDLEISMTEGSGDQAPIVRRYNNVNLGADDNCATAPQGFKNAIGTLMANNTIIDTITLDAGTWTIRKTLTINEASLALQKAAWLQKGLCKTEQQLIDSIKTVLETVTGCNVPAQPVTCASCLTELGDSLTFRNNYLQATGNAATDAEIIAAYKNAKELCGKLCNTTSQQTVTKRQLMLADMMPYGGQYARDTGLSLTYQKYNIFSSYYGTPFFRVPLQGNQPGPYYYNSTGIKDTVNQSLTTIVPNDFVAAFQYSWAEALLPRHPEYNKLVYSENQLKPSYNWINTFLQTNTWAQAEAANYILYSGNTTAAPYNDPFYALSASHKALMETKVKTNYRSIDSLSLTLSMWQIAYGDVRCKTLINLNSRKSCYASAPQQPLVSPSAPFNNLTTAEKDQVWLVFRNLYANERDYHVNDYINTNVPLSDADQIVNNGYQLHFPTEAQLVRQNNSNGDWNWWPATPGGAPNVPGDPGSPLPVTQTYASRCDSYINNWRQALLQCPELAAHPSRDAIIAEITSKMAAVCKKGSDASNPYGSSEVAPNTPVDGSPRSFEEVINSVLTNYGIPKSNLCNPYMIEFPKPYGKGPKFTPELVTVLDTCNCSRFTQLKNAASTAGYNPAVLSSLNQYFKATYKDTITAALFDAFSSCSQLGMQTVCYNVTDTLYLPCNTSNPCGIATRAANNTQAAKITLPANTPKQSLINRPICAIGYHWSSVLNRCVPDDEPEPQPCLIGYHWDPVERRCVPDIILCEIGYHWDPEVGDCVPDPVELPCPFYCTRTKCVDVPVYNIPLPSPQPWPDFLKCNYTLSAKCLTCASLSSLTLEFKSLFGTPYNTAPVISTNLTAQQISYNVLYQRFINYRTGFQYSWLDYARAASDSSCNLANPAGNAGIVKTVICADSKPLSDTTAVVQADPPCQQAYNKAVLMATQLYTYRTQTLLADFEAAYRAKCLAAKDLEVFTVKSFSGEYHYTLYYYDMAGNLVKTVSPKGARPDFDTAFLRQVSMARAGGTQKIPSHVMVTDYRYNSLNNVTDQNSPDGGASQFWYDRLSRLVVSRNAQQAIDNKYSYTVYDNLGRLTEVGQKPQTTGMSQTISQDSTALKNWIFTAGGVREQITFTVYDQPYVFQNNTYLVQRNLRNRVSFSASQKLATDALHYTASFYTYDIQGRVDTLLKDFAGIPEMAGVSQRFKKMAYNYDLVGGKVNLVSYQPGEQDAFYHRYKYDAENRLTEVETSRDKVLWQRDAAYQYYKYGPMARTELGAQRVQGIDFAYTLQGWLKGVNSTNTGNVSFDMGQDGLAGAGNDVVARDALGFSLHYFDAVEGSNTWIDYKTIQGAIPFARPVTASGFVSLYNGNPGAISMNNAGLTKGSPASTNALPLFYRYGYDQLNRMVSMQAYNGLDVGSNQWAPVAINDYKESVSYDPNGNILGYWRNGAPSVGGATVMDSLNYYYDAGTNRLNYVTDSVPASRYAKDIDKQKPGNYRYNAIGNLVADDSAGITKINWDAYGKIASVEKGSNITTYGYDPTGNRIVKTENGKTTIYVRDGMGNVVSVYEKPAATALKQIELYMYSSSRLGMATAPTVAPGSVALQGGLGAATLRTLTRGEKVFEMTNHLGNVLTTVTDRKLQHSSDSSSRDYYMADIVAATDYLPYGMSMSGREVTIAGVDDDGSYRYGFNGQEQSKELHNYSYTAEFWQYDARIGRRWNLDPKPNTSLSPYNAFSGNPVWYSDNRGDTIIDPLIASYVGEDYRAWRPMLFTQAPASLFKQANNRFRTHRFTDQKLSDASGPQINLDFYWVQIDQLPPNFKTAGDFFDYVRKNFGKFLTGGGNEMEPYDKGEEKIWNSSDPSSAIMRFRGFVHGIQLDDADVITTNYTRSDDMGYWVFRPVTDYSYISQIFASDKGHPLAGNREFGITKHPNGYTFYIQAVDRMWSVGDNLVGGWIMGDEIYRSADVLWKAVMNNIVNEINSTGGKAWFHPEQRISKRIDYNQVIKESDKKAILERGN
jgi:hypothetical protein